MRLVFSSTKKCLQAKRLAHLFCETKKPHLSGVAFSYALVTPQGFEPRTSSAVTRCSIQLSYGAYILFSTLYPLFRGALFPKKQKSLISSFFEDARSFAKIKDFLNFDIIPIALSGKLGSQNLECKDNHFFEISSILN